jgi:hypothetical protein
MNINKKTIMTILLFIGIGSACVLSGEPEREDNPLSGSDGFHPSVLIPQDEILHDRSDRSPNKFRAFLYSFILPGAGEYYAGSKKMAAIFLGTEAALWTTFFGFRTYGYWKKQDYIHFAIAHAGINSANKDHQFYVAIEHYENIRAYNEAKLQQRDVGAMYPEGGQYDWQWDSKDNRLKYEDIRVASDRAYANSILVIGGIVLNHLVSGIDAMRLAAKSQKQAQNRIQLGFSCLPEGGMQVMLWKVF